MNRRKEGSESTDDVVQNDVRGEDGAEEEGHKNTDVLPLVAKERTVARKERES